MREKCGPHSQGSRRCRARSQQLGSLLGCAAERAAALGCLFASHLGNLCAVWPPLFGLSVRTRREKHACMQCAAVRGCHEERERHERAIPLVFLRPLRGES